MAKTSWEPRQEQVPTPAGSSPWASLGRDTEDGPGCRRTEEPRSSPGTEEGGERPLKED